MLLIIGRIISFVGIGCGVSIIIIYIIIRKNTKQYWNVHSQENGLFSGNENDLLTENEQSIFQKDIKKIVINPLRTIIVLSIMSIVFMILGYFISYL